MEDISFLSIDELRKKVEEKEKALKSIFVNPIDKFTDVDDLLRENLILQRQNIILQKDLIEEQHISNKLLLHILFKRDSNGSIVPYEPEGINTEAILASLGAGDDYQTINIEGSGKDAQYKEDGAGFVEIIKLVSSSLDTDNKDYSIEVVCDDNILYKGTWDSFEARSASEKGLSCYEDEITKQYLLSIIDIYYSDRFEVKIFASKAYFSLFQVKFHRKV